MSAHPDDRTISVTSLDTGAPANEQTGTRCEPLGPDGQPIFPGQPDQAPDGGYTDAQYTGAPPRDEPAYTGARDEQAPEPAYQRQGYDADAQAQAPVAPGAAQAPGEAVTGRASWPTREPKSAR